MKLIIAMTIGAPYFIDYCFAYTLAHSVHQRLLSLYSVNVIA